MLIAMQVPVKTPSNLGSYLRQLRLARGFDSVSDYLRRYPMPITDTYYRDLENRRKTVSIETSEQICSALEADIHSFYYYYLKDFLPENIVATLSPPAKALSELADTQPDSWFYLYLPNQFHVLDERTNQFFSERLDLFSALLFIACNSPAGVTDKQLAYFLTTSSIETPVDEVLQLFEDLKLISISKTTPRRITSARVLLPKDLNKGLRNKWLLAETENSLNKLQNPASRKDVTLLRFGVKKIRKDKYKAVLSRVAALMNEIRLSNSGMNENSQAYSSQIVISSRVEAGD